MKEFKGTKGKWSYCPSEIDKHKPFSILVEGTGSMLADVYLKTDWSYKEGMKILPKETEANAKLIVAAPDLLDVAEKCLIGFKWRMEEEPETLDKSDYEMYDELKQAINKAVGDENQ